MKKYQLLDKYRYSVHSDRAEIEKEYQRRLSGYSTVQTHMMPTLITKEKFQEKKYPIFFVETREINYLVSQVYKLSKQILELVHSDNLPIIAQNSFVNSLLTNEIYFTNQIEGVKTDKNQIGTIIGDLHTIDTKTKKSVTKRPKRLESTIKMYNDSLSGQLIKIHNPEDLRKIYDQLLAKEISAEKLPDGQYFRNGSVRIGTETDTVHIPPEKEADIVVAMMQLIEFMNDDGLNESIKAIVTHFMFENTHPFYDGNGRTGRYLLSSYLSNKIDIFTGVSISTAIHDHVQKYYRAFKEAGTSENRADLTNFVTAMLEIIISGQENVIQQLNDLKQQLIDKAQNMKNSLKGKIDKDDFAILFVLLQSGLFSMMDTSGIKDNELIEFLNKTDHKRYPKHKVHDAIERLEQQQIIDKIQGRPKQHKLAATYL